MPDTWAAYQVDEALTFLGVELEARMDTAELEARSSRRDPDRARRAALERALGLSPAAPASPQARPAAPPRHPGVGYDLSGGHLRLVPARQGASAPAGAPSGGTPGSEDPPAGGGAQSAPQAG